MHGSSSQVGQGKYRDQVILAHDSGRDRDPVQDQVEIIVNDWGSHVPLRKVLKLTGKARHLTHFLEVPPDMVTAVQKDSPFAEVLARNVSARRSGGDYIGRIDQDTLIDPRFFQVLAPVLRGEKDLGFDPVRAFMFSGRRSIPVEFTRTDPSLADVLRIIQYCRHLFPKEGQGRDSRKRSGKLPVDGVQLTVDPGVGFLQPPDQRL
ncbi:MAG: hypothetical protein V1793_13815 [Pseudomonadota bacterium]